MAETSNFWKAWSPYLSDLENNHLDLKTINTLMEVIRDPVLVVGAGQGLLVEELQKQGFRADGVDLCPEMVEYAEERRGLKLVQADAADLPFNDDGYATTIIATGVVDFMKDEEQIRRILHETIRVTEATGKVLVAFYKVHPAAEKFFRRIGIIKEDGTMRHRRVFELSRQDPKSFISSVRTESNLSVLEAMIHSLRMSFFLPPMERKLKRNMANILRSAPNADELLELVPETIPYRNSEAIAALFRRMDMPVNKLTVFDPCVVVDLAWSGQVKGLP